MQKYDKMPPKEAFEAAAKTIGKQVRRKLARGERVNPFIEAAFKDVR